MKILIIGSSASNSDVDKEKFSSFIEWLGEVLASKNHQLILCSPHKNSADYQILLGFSRSSVGQVKEKIIVHCPNDHIIMAEWHELERATNLQCEIKEHDGPTFRGEGDKIQSMDGLKLAYLLCQLKAIEECDLLITLSGNPDGASALLIPIAKQKNTPIIPFHNLGGISATTFYQLQGDLVAKYGDQKIKEFLRNPRSKETLLYLIDGIKAVKKSTHLRIFLSYSWKRGNIADLVEAFIRRRTNISIFRDERDIKRAENINEKIASEIKNECHIFIGLWCQDYVTSPYCHDEVELWTKNRRREDMFLLRLDDTRPVWSMLRENQGDRETFISNWPVVGTDRAKIELELNKIIDTAVDEK